MIKLSASTFRYILQGTNDETIIEAGNSSGNDVPKTYILARWGELTVENALECIKTLAEYANVFEYSEIIHERKINVTLSHNFGAKGSLFLQHYIQAIFAPLGKLPRFLPDENAVVFELQ